MFTPKCPIGANDTEDAALAKIETMLDFGQSRRAEAIVNVSLHRAAFTKSYACPEAHRRSRSRYLKA